MNQEVLMVMGSPASGKGTKSKELSTNHVYLNRDQAGGQVIDLLPKMRDALSKGQSVLLDNTFPTIDSRRPFIQLAQNAGVPIHLHFIDTSSDDALINSCWRMIENHGQVFYTPNDIKEHPIASKSPNTFPTVVIFKYHKELEKPSITEGFSSLTKHKFVRRPLSDEYCNSAYIFDYDDTLRRSTGELKFPTKISEVEILPRRKEKLKELEGNLLLGVSNQSGISKKQLTRQDAIDCFNHTNELLDVNIEFVFCEHGVPPTCYCRKPGSGLGISLIHKYKLDPKKVTFVGDQTTDKTWAKRLGFNYVDAKVFFND